MSDQLRIINKLPTILKNEFWTQLIGSVEEEILLMRAELEKKKYFYNIDQSDPESLYDLAKIMFGNSYSAALNLSNLLRTEYGLSELEVLNLLRYELKKKPYQIIYKGDLKLYKTFFNSFGFSFPFQISIFSTISSTFEEVTGYQKIQRNLDYFLSEENQEGIVGIQRGDGNYLGITQDLSAPTLDHANGYRLDATLLDQDSIELDKQSFDIVAGTKHIAFELVVQKVYFKKEIPSLFPFEALVYIKEIIKQYKRMGEVPHVGAQFTVKSTNGGFFDYVFDLTSERIPFSNLNFTGYEDNLTRISYGFSELEGYGGESVGSEGLSNSLNYPNALLQKGKTARFTIQVSEISENFFIVDGDRVVKAKFSDLGENIIDIEWTSDVLGFSIQGFGDLDISSIEIEYLNDYTDLNTQMKVASNRDYILEDISEISYLSFGYGQKRLPSVNDLLYEFPDSLEKPIANIKPLEAETFSNSNYLGSISEYTGQLFNDIILHDSLETVGTGLFDGTNQTFTGNIPAKFLTLKPGTLILELRRKDELSGDLVVEDYIEDNGYGVLIGQNNKLQGSINYVTGAYSLTSSFIASTSTSFSLISAENYVSGTLLHRVYGDSGLFSFTYKGKQYGIKVGEDGKLDSDFEFFDKDLSSFVLNIDTSSYDFHFTREVLLEDTKFIYQFDKDSIYDSTYSLVVNKGYTNKHYPITEVGVFGKTKADDETKLLSYSTFAPIELYSNEFHLNFGVVLEK